MCLVVGNNSGNVFPIWDGSTGSLTVPNHCESDCCLSRWFMMGSINQQNLSYVYVHMYVYIYIYAWLNHVICFVTCFFSLIDFTVPRVWRTQKCWCWLDYFSFVFFTSTWTVGNPEFIAGCWASCRAAARKRSLHTWENNPMTHEPESAESATQRREFKKRNHHKHFLFQVQKCAEPTFCLEGYELRAHPLLLAKPKHQTERFQPPKFGCTRISVIQQISPPMPLVKFPIVSIFFWNP